MGCAPSGGCGIMDLRWALFVAFVKLFPCTFVATYLPWHAWLGDGGAIVQANWLPKHLKPVASSSRLAGQGKLSTDPHS